MLNKINWKIFALISLQFTLVSLRESTNLSKNEILDNFEEMRKKILKNEKESMTGFDIVLNENEEKVNKIIMKAKNIESDEGFKNPHSFNPSRSIFDVLESISNSQLFKILRQMPKGGVLHAHDMALCSIQFLVNLTYEPNLWQCKKRKYIFKFAKTKPENNDECKWVSVNELRRNFSNYDKNLEQEFSLSSAQGNNTNMDINDIWKKFLKKFELVIPLLTYKPVWKKYFKQALKEFQEDGVLYLEIRSVLPVLYDLNGTTYSVNDTVTTYIEALKEFKEDNKNFIGAKLIYAPLRNVKRSVFDNYITIMNDLQKKYPDFIAGFDLVGQEDTGQPLYYFREQLLNMSSNVKFFFHSGETNWYGKTTDENLIDAVLLNTTRIGHGFAVLKHPEVLKQLKEKNIAIEINPISNQVLMLNNDNRNHPGSYLFANNYPVVISSDDPSFWNVTPLSHDFYIAFLGIASAASDLRFLKKLAINSIEYSALNVTGKKQARRIWEEKWNEFINSTIKNFE